MSIPRRIIQTARSRELPPLARAASTNFRLLHPDWENLFFDDEQVIKFIQEEFPGYQQLFNSFPYKIQRFDFFRYLAVYRYGGFYFDLDVFLWRELNDLVEERCVFPFEELTLNKYLRSTLGMDWEIGNYAFGAEAGDPFLGAVIENCVRAQRDRGWLQPMMADFPFFFRSDFEVLNSTGPGLLSRTFAENRSAAGGVRVLFPTNVLDVECWHQFGDYGIHLMEGSWRAKGSFLRRRLAGRWESLTRKRNAKVSEELGPNRDPGALWTSNEREECNA